VYIIVLCNCVCFLGTHFFCGEISLNATSFSRPNRGGTERKRRQYSLVVIAIIHVFAVNDVSLQLIIISADTFSGPKLFSIAKAVEGLLLLPVRWRFSCPHQTQQSDHNFFTRLYIIYIYIYIFLPSKLSFPVVSPSDLVGSNITDDEDG